MHKLALVCSLFTLLAACGGGYSGGPSTGNIAPASISNLTEDEAARLYPKATACVVGEFYADPDWSQPLMTGPGFEDCQRIIADLKAKYQHDVAVSRAEADARAARAEADDLVKRRAIISKPDAN